jgi:hypothetical protein
MSSELVKYRSWSGWRNAVREAGATRLDGDRDIANAFTAEGGFVGEWDGDSGYVVGNVRGASRVARRLLRGRAPVRPNPTFNMPQPKYRRGQRVAFPNEGVITGGELGVDNEILYVVRHPDGFESMVDERDIVLEVQVPKPAPHGQGMNSAELAEWWNGPEGRENPRGSTIRVGQMVIGIMGVDGGYVGRVTRISHDGRRRIVHFVDPDGVERATPEFNVSTNVPSVGQFPRKNPRVSSGGIIDGDDVNRGAAAMSNPNGNYQDRENV